LKGRYLNKRQNLDISGETESFIQHNTMHCAKVKLSFAECSFRAGYKWIRSF